MCHNFHPGRTVFLNDGGVPWHQKLLQFLSEIFKCYTMFWSTQCKKFKQLSIKIGPKWQPKIVLPRPLTVKRDEGMGYVPAVYTFITPRNSVAVVSVSDFYHNHYISFWYS